VIYITKQGETWDSIAKDALGEEHLADLLMQANMSKVGAGYFVFPASIELIIPLVAKSLTQIAPPWRTA